MVETRADFGGQRRVGRHHVPVEQQVVVVEHLLFELGLDVGAAERGELLFPVQAPRVRRLQRVPQRPLRVDAMRVDAEARVLAREALHRLREAEPVTHDVHQVRGVAAVEHAEAGIETEPRRVFADQAVADRVERAGPRQAQVVGDAGRRIRLGRERLGHDFLRASGHFERGAAREREQQHALRRHAGEQQARDAVRERAGLARARPGDDEQWRGLNSATAARLAVHHRLALRGIERVEGGVRAGHGRRSL